MRKFSSPSQLRSINKLTRSTKLYSEQSDNKQGSLDFSIQPLQQNNYKAAYHLFSELNNKITKISGITFRYLKQYCGYQIRKNKQKQYYLKLLLKMQKIMIKNGFQEVQRYNKRKYKKILSSKAIKNNINKLIKFKKYSSIISMLQNTGLICHKIVKKYQKLFQQNSISQQLEQQLKKLPVYNVRNQTNYFEKLENSIQPILQEYTKKRKRGKPSSIQILLDCLKNMINMHNKSLNSQNKLKLDIQTQRKSMNGVNNLKIMDKKINDIFSKAFNSDVNYKTKTAQINTLKNTINQQIQTCEQNTEQQILSSRKNLLNMLKVSLQHWSNDKSIDSNHDKSSSQIIISPRSSTNTPKQQTQVPANKLNQIYKCLNEGNSGNKPQKYADKMKRVLDFQDKNTRQKTQVIKLEINNIIGKNGQLQKQVNLLNKKLNKQKNDQLDNQLQNANKKIKQLQFRILQLQKDKETKQQLNMQEFNNQIQFLKDKVYNLQQNLLQAQKQLKAAQSKMLKISSTNRSKDKKLTSIKKQYERFNNQFSIKKDQQKQRKSSLQKMIQESRRLCKGLTNSNSILNKQKSNTQTNKKQISSIFYNLTTKLIDLSQKEKQQIQKQIQAITQNNNYVDSKSQMQEFIIMLISRKLNLIKNIESSDDQNNSNMQALQGLKKYYRNSNQQRKSNTPRKSQVSREKQDKTIKR